MLFLSRTRIIKNTIFVGPKNETICGFKRLLKQRTQCCDYIAELIKTTDVNPDKNSDSLASLNQSRFPFQIGDISLTQDQTGSISFFRSQKDTYYVHIG